MNKYDKGMMETAIIWSRYSKCSRRKVAAVIAKENNIISIGYNGTPTGLTKVLCNKCEMCDGTGSFTLDYQTICCPSCGGTGKVSKSISDNDCEELIYYCPVCDFTSKNKEDIVSIKDDTQQYCKRCGNAIILKEEYRTRSIVVHAEQNAIANAARSTISTKGATIYITTAPCPTCAILIHQAGINRVVYLDDYHRNDGIEVLKRLGVEIIQYKGYLDVEYRQS